MATPSVPEALGPGKCQLRCPEATKLGLEVLSEKDGRLARIG